MFEEIEIRKYTANILEAYQDLSGNRNMPDIKEFLLLRKAAMKELSQNSSYHPSISSVSIQNKQKEILPPNKIETEEKIQPVDNKKPESKKIKEPKKQTKTTKQEKIEKIEEIESAKNITPVKQGKKKTAYEILRELEDQWN